LEKEPSQIFEKINMILKILGILDILAAIFFWLFAVFHIIPTIIILISAFYLLAKGIIFVISRDVASILDIITSITFFISLSFQFPLIIVFLITLYLIQKGIFSML
jgi:hypothetical protein